MNKKETTTILNAYKSIIYSQEICKIDKEDSRREMKNLLDMLGMKKERYTIENEIIAERDSLSYSAKEMYLIIFETFLRYGKYVHYDLNEIDRYYYELQYHMTEEENKCHKAQINYIISNKVA